MNLTLSQQNAINTRDCSLIISAGAGSGKTAVLTERILERICDENDDCNINDFLIVTFTNDAAGELNDRIRKKLSERGLENPTNKKIIKNLALLPLAKISTINSFCYEIVRENFQKLGLAASVRIADPAEIAVIRESIMNRTVDEYFEQHGDNEAFLAAYEVFAGAKDDGNFIKVLLDLDIRLSNIADRDGYCESIVNQYREIAACDEILQTSFGMELKGFIQKGADRVISVLGELMRECAMDEFLAKRYYPVIEHEYEFARELYHACDKGYDAVYECVLQHKIGKFSGGKIPDSFTDYALKNKASEQKKAVSDSFVKKVMDFCRCPSSLLKSAAADTSMIISKLFELLELFRKNLWERKEELSIIEFSDTERFTLSLLTESISPFKATELAMQLRSRYKEIYIDEYQDVNPLQDMIFKAISNHIGDDECNRFMVGDIKQSIYGFRGAKSGIFMSYRDSFGDIWEDRLQKRIFMNDNFRCSESVIGVTNIIFEKLMNTYYTDGDRLSYARQEKQKVSDKVKMLVFKYDKESADGLTSAELEATMICDKIKEFVNNPMYTDSNGKMYTYSDVCILTRNRPTLKIYESVLNNAGIPASCEVGESFFDKKEIILCINILTSIDNPERDIYLAGFMRSFAGSFSDDELAVLRKEYRNMSLYRAVVNCSEKGCKNDLGLMEKCRCFVEKLREYRTFSRGKSADKLLWKIYTDMDLLNMCCTDCFTDDTKGARKNLLKLYSIARSFSKTSFRGVGAFIDYIKGSMNKSDIKAERENNGNCVTLMTIHKSKGLEFPICFVSNLSGDFNKDDSKARLVFSDKAGIACCMSDTSAVISAGTDTGLITVDTPFRKFIASGIEQDMLQEEIRVLYVAMTRARDILVLTSSLSKMIENTMKDVVVSRYTESFDSANDYASLILASLASESALKPLYDRAGIEFVPESCEAEKYLECSYIECSDLRLKYDELTCCVTEDKEDEPERDLIDEKLLETLRSVSDIKYTKSDSPAKITVSQLKKGLIDEEKTRDDAQYQYQEDEYKEPVPVFVLDEKKPDGAAKGTAMHMFMQFCDFERCVSLGCEAEADRLLENGFIDSVQREILDISKLNEFFASDFYNTLSKSRSIYREQRFNLETDDFECHLPDGILVQGVVDLFYENDDGTYTVVDFKTDRVFGEGAEQVLVSRHKEQLIYYKRAVEEMTGCRVSDVIIYSFSLMKDISVE